MYISKLTIENYRNFDDFEITLKPFTLIIGENNTGKTNLLNALGLIFSNEVFYFKKRLLETDDINFSAIKGFKAKVADERNRVEDIIFPEVRVEVIMEGFNEDQEAVVGDWFIDKDLKRAKLTYVFRNRNPKALEWLKEQRMKLSNLNMLENESPEEFFNRKVESVDFPIKDYDYSIHGGEDFTKQADRFFLKMLMMEHLGALRDAKRELSASGNYTLLYKILKNRDESKFFDLKQHMSNLIKIIKYNEELGSIKKQIKSYLNRISLQEEGIDNGVDFQFSSIETAELLKKFSLIYGNEPVNVDRNGLGRNNLLYIALVLSHLNGTSLTNGNIYFKLIGIEEPEAHLHPHLQEHLAKNIKNEANEKTQIIMTSHSPYIVNKLDLEDTVIIYKDENEGTKNHYILHNMNKKEYKNNIHYLKKFLDATKSTMFFARRLILVEGISEQLLIPVMFKMFTDCEIEKIRCNIVNANGLAFRNFLNIIKNGYFIKCAVLTDADTETKAKNRADKLEKDYKDCDFIGIFKTIESTFEKDLIKANESGKGKTILCKALKATRPSAGKNYIDELGDVNIAIESYFELIKDYKSEFAYNLQELLKADSKGFKIPDYIQNSFNFLLER
jgi:putative ATP-dependent endonuclease of OLD family